MKLKVNAYWKYLNCNCKKKVFINSKLEKWKRTRSSTKRMDHPNKGGGGGAAGGTSTAPTDKPSILEGNWTFSLFFFIIYYYTQLWPSHLCMKVLKDEYERFLYIPLILWITSLTLLLVHLNKFKWCCLSKGLYLPATQ